MGDFNQDNDDFNEDEDWKDTFSGRDAAIFLVEMTEEMFEKPDDESDSHIHLALQVRYLSNLILFMQNVCYPAMPNYYQLDFFIGWHCYIHNEWVFL